MVTRRTIRGLILWMHKYNLEVDELKFFRVAYYDVYKRADERCNWCFDLYIRKGVVPEFVRIFIQRYFVKKGG